jgi:hypothetical protein
MRAVNIGDCIGDWTVIAAAPKKGKYKQWECRCKCGATHSVRQDNLKWGRSKQCALCGKRLASMPVVSRDGTVRYNTLTTAAKKLQMDKRTLKLAIETGTPAWGHVWLFADADRAESPG